MAANDLPNSEIPPTFEELSAVLPGIVLERLIARGGMGVVYLGRQVSLDRRVAVKILPASLSLVPGFEERFAAEARLLSRLPKAGFPAVHDFGRTAGGQWYLVQEFIDGPSLRQWVEAERRSIAECVAVIEKASCALTEAHASGITHGDIKPDNILIENVSGDIKIVDFGLAELHGSRNGPVGTLGGERYGSPGYAAPELTSEGGRLSPAADVFGLAATLCDLLTGSTPDPGPQAAASAVLGRMPGPLAGELRRALDPDPALRHATAAEFGLALRAAVEEPSPTAPKTSRASRPGPLPSQPHRLQRLLAGLVLALAGLAGWLFYRHGGHPPADGAAAPVVATDSAIAPDPPVAGPAQIHAPVTPPSRDESPPAAEPVPEPPPVATPPTPPAVSSEAPPAPAPSFPEEMAAGEPPAAALPEPESPPPPAPAPPPPGFASALDQLREQYLAALARAGKSGTPSETAAMKTESTRFTATNYMPPADMAALHQTVRNLRDVYRRAASLATSGATVPAGIPVTIQWLGAENTRLYLNGVNCRKTAAPALSGGGMSGWTARAVIKEGDVFSYTLDARDTEWPWVCAAVKTGRTLLFTTDSGTWDCVNEKNAAYIAAPPLMKPSPAMNEACQAFARAAGCGVSDPVAVGPGKEQPLVLFRRITRADFLPLMLEQTPATATTVASNAPPKVPASVFFQTPGFAQLFLNGKPASPPWDLRAPVREGVLRTAEVGLAEGDCLAWKVTRPGSYFMANIILAAGPPIVTETRTWYATNGNVSPDDLVGKFRAGVGNAAIGFAVAVPPTGCDSAAIAGFLQNRGPSVRGTAPIWASAGQGADFWFFRKIRAADLAAALKK